MEVVMCDAVSVCLVRVCGIRKEVKVFPAVSVRD